MFLEITEWLFKVLFAQLHEDVYVLGSFREVNEPDYVRMVDLMSDLYFCFDAVDDVVLQFFPFLLVPLLLVDLSLRASLPVCPTRFWRWSCTLIFHWGWPSTTTHTRHYTIHLRVCYSDPPRSIHQSPLYSLFALHFICPYTTINIPIIL